MIRTAADTQLPWTLEVTAEGSGPEVAELARRLLMSGFGVIMILMIGTAYSATRAFPVS